MYVAHQEKVYDFLSRDDLYDLIATRRSTAVDNDLRYVTMSLLTSKNLYGIQCMYIQYLLEVRTLP